MRTPDNGRAAPVPASAALDTAHSADSSIHDTLTVLESLKPLLTKIFCSDGSVVPYGDAANFKVKTAEITGWPDLVKLLQSLHKNPKRSIIRGKLTGNISEKPGTFVRTNANFSDQPLHWFMIDVDGFEPGFALPTDPAAVIEFIEEVLPPCFHKASYYWHMSSSAGQSSKLKCHIHFISKTAYTSAQMGVWAKQIGKQVDSALYRRVQHHYTADPIYEEGREDPVKVRAGFHQGEEDFVDLVITADARETGAGEDGHDMKLVDPSEKEGIIGLFHRTYSAEEVLLELLEGEFEQLSERNYSWFNGGGTPRGVWVHEDGMHVGSSHNTWPIDGIANLWDLVRVFKFGHLDHADDEFDQLDIDSREIQAKPSHLAMLEWANGQEAIKAQAAEESQQSAKERQTTLESWRSKIRFAPDEGTLREIVCPGIAGDSSVSAQQRDALAAEVNKKLKSWGESPGIAAAKKLIKPTEVKKKDNSPEWLRDWYYVTDRDLFYRYDTDQWLSSKGFNAKYTRLCPRDDEGKRMAADYFALEVFPIKVVTRGVYLPMAGKTFTWPGITCVNTYRPSTVPKEAETLTSAGRKAVSAVQSHILAMCGDRQWLADHLIDFLAHNVQFPSLKIRHAPVIQGIEGDGKSLIGTLLAHVMGEANVRVIAPEVISKSDFNGWSEGACVGVLEELRLQGTNRFDVLNSVKPCITNDTISIHRKRMDPYQCPNTMNYIAFTNHKDALPLNDTDRRWLVIFVPWRDMKEFAEIVQCEPEDYFEHLHNCIFNHADSLRRWLLDRDLSGFKRNKPAPMTDEKTLMVGLGVSEEMTVARDLIESGGLGFSDQVISTRMLSRAMVASGVEAPKTNFMQRLMLDFGYRKFPEPVKWDGETHRPVWTKHLVTDKEEVRRLLDATAEGQLEEDFQD